MATHSSVLAREIPWTEKPGGYSPYGHKELDTTEHAHTHTLTHSDSTGIGEPKLSISDR